VKYPASRSRGSARVLFGLLVVVTLGICAHEHPRAPKQGTRPTSVILPSSDRAPILVTRADHPGLPGELTDRAASRELRQERFVAVLLPMILAENERLGQLRQTAMALLRRARSEVPLPAGNALWLRELASTYKVTGDPLDSPAAAKELLSRVDQFPPSLVLAQAALESGWGSSGAARLHHDLFGMSNVVSKAARERNGKNRSTPRFVHLADSIQSYMHNLNTHSAYPELRRLRAGLRKDNMDLRGMELVRGLSPYSEMRQEYVKKLKAVIRGAALARFDYAELEVTESSLQPASIAARAPARKDDV
jgi:Bax protein